MKLYKIILSFLLCMGANCFASKTAGDVAPVSKTPLGMTIITYCREGMFEKFPGAYDSSEFMQTKVEVQDQALQDQLKAIADQCLESIEQPLTPERNKGNELYFPFKANVPFYSVALGISKPFNSPDGQMHAARLIKKGKLNLVAKFFKALRNTDMYVFDGCRPCGANGKGSTEAITLSEEQKAERLKAIAKFNEIKARKIN